MSYVIELKSLIILEDPDFFNKQLTDKERSLYDRQFRLNGWNQRIIKNSRILVAGVGGLGCEIAKNLAMVGVGHIDLVDLDVIEHSNLNRQILFSEGKVGQSKATVAADKLKEINPNLTIKGYHSSLERLDPEIYKSVDLVIGGLDSLNARLNLNAQCVRFKKPLVDGGVSGYHGHVYTVFPYENACYECNPPPPSESDEMAACTVVGVPRKRVHCVFKANLIFQEKFNREPNAKNIKHIKIIEKVANKLAGKYNFLPPFSEAEIYQIIDRHEPGLITINAIISSIQSHEAIKILNWKKGNTHLGEPTKLYIILNGMTMKFYSIEKRRNPECRQCGEKVRRADININSKAQCKEIIDKLIKLGFERDLEMEPILTIMDFNMVKEINLNYTPYQNELRNFELITAVGFKGGEILLTLNIL